MSAATTTAGTASSWITVTHVSAFRTFPTPSCVNGFAPPFTDLYSNRVRLKGIHFAWDSMRESDAILEKLRLYASLAKRKPNGDYATVYVLTNYDSTPEQDLYRVETLREMGYDPYVMIYEKPTAPLVTKRLQGWVNNKRVFHTVKRFEDFRHGTRNRKAAAS